MTLIFMFGMGLLIYYIGKSISREKREKERIKELYELFDRTIDMYNGNDDCKVIYSNKNTGTISVRSKDGSHKSIQVYKGYNSHYRDN